MKYYESSYEDYINSNELFNIHPELNNIINNLPNKINELPNLLIYGSSGIGKYTQVLKILKKYSPSQLKYDKKITINTDKQQQYNYHISDIHYEIDMSLLGCNSKTLWHEIFFQIVDIVSIKPDKTGIILCKNFHLINSELLEIFYSYIQQYNNVHSNIIIKYIIISEHVSFLPYKILNNCYKIGIKRPDKSSYQELYNINEKKRQEKVHNLKITNNENSNILNTIDTNGILNIKEIRSFTYIDNINNFPEDLFNKICDNIIYNIENIEKIKFTEFRDTLYEILTYDIDINDCLWYIIYYFSSDNKLNNEDISNILIKCYIFLKYYNNNYRPIYHLENIMFYIINKINKYNELPKRM